VLEWHHLDVEATAVTDTRKLGAVVRNLVHNACKFTERGWVRATLHVRPEEIELTVADSGIGIHASDHEAIFEMFRQADGSDRRRYGGSGLGLHIVRRYVDMLGGHVTLEAAPGAGSCFTARLPRWAPAEVSAPARSAAPAAAPLRARRAATA
jgi:signal transduction histidine kinase